MLAAAFFALAGGPLTFGADEKLLRDGCFVLLGNAWVQGEAQRIEARAAVVFLDRWVVYAEGGILFTDAEARSAVEAEEFVYDFRGRRGAAREARLTQRFARKARGAGLLGKGEVDHLVVRARRLFREGDVFRAEGVVASTCNFGFPHWSVTADEMRLSGRDGVARGARLRLGSATVLKLSSVGFDAEEGLAVPSPRVRAGHSSKWGWDVGAGAKFSPRGLFDYVTPFVGHRSERGWRGELDLEGPGRFWYSFQDESETGASDDAERAQRYFDAREPKLVGDPVRSYRASVLFDQRHPGATYQNELLRHEGDFRYDVEYHHSWRRGEWRGSVEAFYPSDRDYLREYDDARLKREREGETALYFWRSGGTYSELAVSAEPCEWRTSTERLPSFSFTAPIVPLPGGTVLETDFSAGYLRRHWDEFWDIDDFESFRAAGSVSLSRPFHAGPIGVRPFVGTSGAYYGNGDDLQGACVAGVEARTFLAGEFRGGKLRHILEPRASLFCVGPKLMAARDVLDFDEVDDLHETSIARIELANLWQTGEEGRRSTVGALKLWADAFLDADEAEELNSGRAFDQVNASGFCAPCRGLRLFGLAGYDAYGGDIERAACGLSLQGERSGLTLAHRIITENDSRGIWGSSQASLNLWWRVDPKWRLSAFGAYQFEDNDEVTRGFSAHGLVVERHYHDWALRMRFKYDEGRDETSAGVSLIVKGYTSNLERVR